MAGTADDGWEHGPGGIVSGEASLHQAGAVVAHKGGSLIVVTHVGFCKRRRRRQYFTLNQIHNGEVNYALPLSFTILISKYKNPVQSWFFYAMLIYVCFVSYVTLN